MSQYKKVLGWRGCTCGFCVRRGTKQKAIIRKLTARKNRRIEKEIINIELAMMQEENQIDPFLDYIQDEMNALNEESGYSEYLDSLEEKIPLWNDDQFDDPDYDWDYPQYINEQMVDN